MKKLLLLPTIIFPYIVCSCIFGIFMDDFMALFDNSIYELLATLTYIFLFALLCNIVYIIINNKKDAFSEFKIALIIKIMHIVAYIIIFIGACVSAITIFTIAISIFLFITDCLTLILSGVLSVYALTKSYSDKKIEFKKYLLSTIMQFVFIMDIIALHYVYKYMKKTV